jgi:hypothetical protein
VCTENLIAGSFLRIFQLHTQNRDSSLAVGFLAGKVTLLGSGAFAFAELEPMSKQTPETDPRQRHTLGDDIANYAWSELIAHDFSLR